MFSLSKRLSLDLFFLLPIVCVAAILIGNYLRYEYLDIGYQDWFMHAFRIRSLDINGLSSWTHTWSNGMNFWNTYQFASHYLVLFISQIFAVSITKAMIFATVGSFILTRVFMYYALRTLGVSRLYSLFGVLLTFAFGQQWISMKDFSIYIPIMFTPLLVLLWVKAYNSTKLIFLTSAIFGATWILHPILGLTFSALYFFMLLFRKGVLGWKKTLLSMLLYIVGGLPFFAEVLSLQAFSNPYLATPQFLSQLIGTPYMGLSLIYVVVLVLTNILWISKVSKLSQWVTIFWLYVLAMLAFIYLSLSGTMPSFINSLQAPRAITIVALFIPMVFVMALQVQFNKLNKVTLAILAVVSGIIVTQSISLASLYTAIPTDNVSNVVSDYFKDSAPEGRVYYDGLTEANYFANPDIRYVNSYAEHMEPHPLAMRFKQLVELPAVMRVVPDSHFQLFKDYAQVLGVEYLFLPKSSPLIPVLTSGEDAIYSIESQRLEDTNGLYSVLRANFPIANAVVYNSEDVNVSFSNISEPNVDTRSYREWDTEVSNLAEIMRSQNVYIADVEYSNSETIKVNINDIDSFENKSVIVTTSYSPYWKSDGIEIEPTALRFMNFNLENKSDVVEMSHSWPSWKTPSYISSIVAIGIGGGIAALKKESKS